MNTSSQVGSQDDSLFVAADFLVLCLMVHLIFYAKLSLNVGPFAER